MTLPSHTHPAAKILMVGYYGRGNFGDDVLMNITHQLLKRHRPDAKISVIADGDRAAYVKAMLWDVELLPSGRHGHFDLIVHGGGGVFFDFEQYGFYKQAAAFILRFVGFRIYLKSERMLRNITRKPRTSSRRRLGLGIGIGGFSPGSPKLRQSLPVLADFDALWLRDAASVIHLKPFASVMLAEIISGSDLAFLTEYWLPAIPPKTIAPRPRLGIILRDWSTESGGTAPAALSEMLQQLAQHYDITGFSFDPASDPEILQLMQPYSIHSWQPETSSIHAFSVALAAQDVVLTSRAHGAICCACLGVPSVIVNIEPKLAQVASMLPNACRLVEPNATAHWPQALAEASRIDPATIAADVARNRTASVAALHMMQRWFA